MPCAIISEFLRDRYMYTPFVSPCRMGSKLHVLSLCDDHGYAASYCACHTIPVFAIYRGQGDGAAVRLGNALEMSMRRVFRADDNDYRRAACLSSTTWSAAGDNKPAKGYPASTTKNSYQQVWSCLSRLMIGGGYHHRVGNILPLIPSAGPTCACGPGI
jgi:hypothetical protein